MPIFKLGSAALLYNGFCLEDFLSLMQASTGNRFVLGEASTFTRLSPSLLLFREQNPAAAQVVASAVAGWCMEHATPDPVPVRTSPRL